MDPIAMEKYLKERYGPKSRGMRGDPDDYDDDQVPDEITQQSLLPDVKSPNLWPVKCRIGEEKLTALLLMRKYLTLETDEKVSTIKFVCLFREYIHNPMYPLTVESCKTEIRILGPTLEPVGSKIFRPGPDLLSIFGPGPDKIKILDPTGSGSGSTRRTLPYTYLTET
jgi:hypothetical protein